MNTPIQASESRFACAIFALVFIVFCAFIIICVVQSGKRQHQKKMEEATVTGHSMIIPEMECPRCLREGREGHLRVYFAECADEKCAQQYRVVWNRKFGTLIPRSEAELPFQEWADGEEIILDELKKKL